MASKTSSEGKNPSVTGAWLSSIVIERDRVSADETEEGNDADLLNSGERFFTSVSIQQRSQVNLSPSTSSIIFLSSTINYANRFDQVKCESELRTRLIPILTEESVEPGLIGPADMIFYEVSKRNKLAALVALNALFLENFSSRHLSAEIVMLAGRIPLEDADPSCVTMATAALSSSFPETVEAGIRAFEQWEAVQYTELLRSADIKKKWLKDYRDRVVSDFEGA